MLPPAAASRSRAAAASTPASSMTIATLALPSAAASASSARSRGAPVAVITMRRTRARSFSFAALTSTMRLSNVLPSRIIEMVETMFSTSFWAVPAFSRVEPASSSGPTTTTISRSTARPSSESGAQTTHAVEAPAAAAASIAPSTYGVRPLALMPITASVAPTPAECTSRRPASASSSAASCSSDEGASAPARRASTWPGAEENVASHSDASTRREPAG